MSTYAYTYAVLHMSRIECYWGRTKGFSHLHSIRLMSSTAFDPGRVNVSKQKIEWAENNGYARAL